MRYQAKNKGRTTVFQVFKLSELEINPENPRQIDPQAKNGLRSSLQRYGLVQPLVVNIHGGRKRIVSGHQRYHLLQEANIRQAACVVVDLPDPEADLLSLTLNNPNITGQFTADIDAHIEAIKASLSESDTALTDLRIEDLRGQIELEGTAQIETLQIRPFRKVHILLSMPVDSFLEVQQTLTELIATKPEIEYEQSAN